MEIKLFLRTLQRGWWIVVVTMLAAMNFSLLISFLTPPVYETSSRFVVSPNAGQFSETWSLVDSMDTLDRRSIINTYRELLASPTLHQTSPEIQQFNPAEFAADYSIAVVVVPDTNILQMTVQGPNPDGVVMVADAIGNQAVAYINQLYPVYNFSILDKPELPTAPIRPQPVQNAALALLIGAILGVGVAFSREQLGNTIDQLRERSVTDSASSAYTRAYFERRLREEITQNPDSSLSFALINFKGLEEMSDVLPQAIADRVLHKVTQTLKSELRGRDIVGRWNKTQLSVLLPSTPGAVVESTFKRIQKYLSEPIYVNESGDVVVHPDPRIGVVSRNQFETAEEIIQRVESAVEQASVLEIPAVVFHSKPFIFDDDGEMN